MRIAVLHNAVPDDAPVEDRDTLVQVETVVAALGRLGHETTAVACTLDLAALHDRMRQERPELVFNLVESLAEDDSLAHLPLAVLDTLGIAYSGSRTEAVLATTNKVLAKRRLTASGLPTPAWIDMDADGEKSEAPPCACWIIKGVCDQASRGLDDGSVLRDAEPAEVRRRLGKRAAETGRPCFAEQFIEGREFNLSMLAGRNGPEVLQPAEIDFSAFPPGKPRIVGHRAKWQADSFEYRHTPRRFGFEAADAPLLDRLRELAEASWELFGVRGWVRVDFRVDTSGQPWILEVNASPCLSPDAGFAAALENARIPFDKAIQRIVEDAVAGTLRVP